MLQMGFHVSFSPKSVNALPTYDIKVDRAAEHLAAPEFGATDAILYDHLN